MADEGNLVPTHYSQSSSHHPSLILEQLNVQRYYGAFCDIVLRVEDVDVRLHKCVLAASSARLQSLVYGMRQECGELLSLKDVSLPGFWPILDYIYTGLLKLETTSVQEVLMAAQTLEIRDVEKICLEYIKLIQGGGAGTAGSNIPESPAPAQTPRADKVLTHSSDTVSNLPTTSTNTPGGVAPPPMFSVASGGALSGQYITPVSPPPPPRQQRNHSDKHLHPAASHSAVMLPALPSHTPTPGGQEIPRAPTPAHPVPPPPPPTPATIPPPALPTPTPPAPPPHLPFPMPPPPPHLTPHPLPPMLPVTSQSTPGPCQPPHYPPTTTPDQPYTPAPVPPRGFPGMPIDTNYVEDYLKLIESFQGEPHPAQPFQQPPPLPPPQTLVPQPPTTPRSLTPNTAPPTPQDSSHLPQTPGPQPPPTPEYFPPPGYQTNSLPPHPPQQLPPPKPIPKLPHQQANTNSTNTSHASNSYVSQQSSGNPRERVFPTPRASGNPIGQMTAEEVRRTVLNVLSKFDDDEEESELAPDDKAHSDKVDSVPPLTSFLNFAPLTQSTRDAELAERGTISDGQDLYGDLQIVSSDSEVSDANELETEGYGTTPDPYSGQDVSYQAATLPPGHNTASEPKDSIIMRMKKATWPNRNDANSVNQTDNNNTNNQILKVGSFEINLDLGSLASPPPNNDSQTADHAQLPKKRGSRRKVTGLDGTPTSGDSIFKDTVKDPSMAHRPLKKRIRLRVKKKYQCQKCGREFVRGEALESHVEQHDRCQLLSCHVCNQKFARVSELTRHQREHSAETFRCLDCQSEFSNSKQYKLHMDSVHREEKAFYCTYPGCEYRAAKLSNLEKHMPIHADMKRYHCHCCGKNFAQPNGLRSHQKSCRQERGYLCDICGAKFNYLQSMKSHRLLHSGEKPHICPDCGAKFTDPRNLKRHRRIHENLFPYQCTECDKRFRHSNSLKAHANTHDRRRTPPDANRRPSDSGTKKRSQDVGVSTPGPQSHVPSLEDGVINIVPQTPRSDQGLSQDSVQPGTTDPYQRPKNYSTTQNKTTAKYSTSHSRNPENYSTTQEKNMEYYSATQEKSMEHNSTMQERSLEHYSTMQERSLEHYSTMQEKSMEHYSAAQENSQEHYSTVQENSQEHYSTAQENSQEHYSMVQENSQEHYSTTQENSQEHYSTAQENSQEHYSTTQDKGLEPYYAPPVSAGTVQFAGSMEHFPAKFSSASHHGNDGSHDSQMSEVIPGSKVTATQ